MQQDIRGKGERIELKSRDKAPHDHRAALVAGGALAVFAVAMVAMVAGPAIAGPVTTFYADDFHHKCDTDPAVHSFVVKGWPRGTDPDFNGNGIVCFYWVRG